MSHTVEKDWTTPAGLRALVLVVHFARIGGHRCGYVGVPKGHTLYGKDYHERLDEISAEAVSNSTIGKKSPILAFTAGVGADEEGQVRRSLDLLLDCHGGLTFAGGGKYPIESDLWWLGFDCSHAGDGRIDPSEESPLFASDEPVRELDYVVAECESLAAQIVEYFPLETETP